MSEKCLKCCKSLRKIRSTEPLRTFFDGWDATTLHKTCFTQMMRDEARAAQPDDEPLGVPCVRCGKGMNVCREEWAQGTMHKKCWKAKVLEDIAIVYEEQRPEREAMFARHQAYAEEQRIILGDPNAVIHIPPNFYLMT